MNKLKLVLLCCISPLLLMGAICGKIPIKQYYVLNYMPTAQKNPVVHTPFPITLRLKDLDIEDAYSRPQLVYRQSPYELRYDSYKLWAVKPARMVTDLIQKHIATTNLASRIIRRYDEGAMPNYELSGTIEAIEEYDSDQLWFAHLAMRLTLTRVSDGKVLFSQEFDNRKKVYQYSTDAVVQELSTILEYIMNQADDTMREVLNQELGTTPVPAQNKDSNPAAAVPQ